METYTLRAPADARPSPRFRIDYAGELNEAQHEAATTLDGPVLVIAGAGSGKTRTLVYRVARLVESGVPPAQILLLTFTRKAAEEMLRPRLGAGRRELRSRRGRDVPLLRQHRAAPGGARRSASSPDSRSSTAATPRT